MGGWPEQWNDSSVFGFEVMIYGRSSLQWWPETGAAVGAGGIRFGASRRDLYQTGTQRKLSQSSNYDNNVGRWDTG